MTMTDLNFTGKEMTKFLALYQALKTIDNLSESESESESEDPEEEDMPEEDNGESCDCKEDDNGMCKCKKDMIAKMKVAAKSSYGQYRKMGTRK
jgi:hypothetical protein